MAEYRAPLEEIRFVLDSICDAQSWTDYPAFSEAGPDLVQAVLDEAGKLAGNVIAPTNRVGDLEGAKLENGKVTTPAVFKDAHRAYVEGGWLGLAFDTEYGGQGLPSTLALAVSEMVTSANMAYSLNSLLSSGAIEALLAHAEEEQKAYYLPRLISGEWSATMNLTEPGAGSDVGALKTRAEPVGDGSYRIVGQKIFISWGDHDLADNIIHLVLARLPDAPAGTRGISMFLVPKFHTDADGNITGENDVRCLSLEHKLGIHASPTCVMSFGENGDCRGYLVGGENRGMANMFTMMNHARVGVGLQGVALAERAYQDAVQYAHERVQGAAIDGPKDTPVPIVAHADVRRMLMTMRAYGEACRAIVYRTAWALDRAHVAQDEEEQRLAAGEGDLLTPIAKAYSTDRGVDVTSLGVQVFGGAGFIEETGAAQHLRDARIAPIYEGTNGIQAMDLIGRKLMMDGGEHWRRLIVEMQEFAEKLKAHNSLGDQADAYTHSVAVLSRVSEFLFARGAEGVLDRVAAATPYLRVFGGVLGGYLLLRQVVNGAEREGHGAQFMESKAAVARFYMEQLLPSELAHADAVLAGAATVMALEADAFYRG